MGFSKSDAMNEALKMNEQIEAVVLMISSFKAKMIAEGFSKEIAEEMSVNYNAFIWEAMGKSYSSET